MLPLMVEVTSGKKKKGEREKREREDVSQQLSLGGVSQTESAIPARSPKSSSLGWLLLLITLLALTNVGHDEGSSVC